MWKVQLKSDFLQLFSMNDCDVKGDPQIDAFYFYSLTTTRLSIALFNLHVHFVESLFNVGNVMNEITI